ncbi:MAG: DNA replication/repair protein RecF [Myxococcales bacterium]|nr:DNA replication/repair protein RecF [Myxococcales bacterium]MCB9707449.1 DNA replication/repair protein RecF [Myxococcales bacterium]
MHAPEISSPHASLCLESIKVEHYRNFDRAEFYPGKRFNVISGPNGAGKSNLLEAIYYLSALRSFRHAGTLDLIGKPHANSRITATVKGGLLKDRLDVVLSRTEARRVLRNEKRPTSAAQYKTCVPAVLFSPGDVELPSGSPEHRRTFVDRILEQMDPTYTASLNTYNRALRSRNKLLKSGGKNPQALRVYDEILASSGEVIGVSRAALIDELSPMSSRAFRATNRDLPELALTYAPSVSPDRKMLLSSLDRSFERDQMRGYTRYGPHSDDVTLALGGQPVRHFASQGQKRAIVLAVKTAELLLLTHKTGKVPVLLLDDVSSELDRTRNQFFFESLSDLGGQVFLTTTHPEFIILNEYREDFVIEDGVISRSRHS